MEGTAVMEAVPNVYQAGQAGELEETVVKEAVLNIHSGRAGRRVAVLAGGGRVPPSALPHALCCN